MANARYQQRSFGGGEVTPEFFGRIDDIKFQTGLARCRNFVTKPHGPAENRAGFEFVREVKDSAKKVKLIPFTFSTTQTMALEAGAGYFRFHTMGSTLLAESPDAYDDATAYVLGDLVSEAGVSYYCIAPTTGNAPPDDDYWYALPANGVYEIPSPYAEADLAGIHHVQSADVLTLVHPNYAPRELRRLGATNWELKTINFAAPTKPAAPTLVRDGGTEEKYNYTYVVTAIGSDEISESEASPQATIKANLYEIGQSIKISWTAVSGASRYNVYKLQGGLFGYIGQTEGTTIDDDDIDPDLSKTPPRYETVFNAANAYPGATSYFEQRRCFAGTLGQPQHIWMTKSGTEANMSFSLPLVDDDRISFRVAAREANTIRHIVPLTELLLFTSSAEWRVTSLNSDAITPTTISVRPQSYVGASNVQPVIVNNTVLYGAARGGHIRELGYQRDAGGFVSGDLSLRAPHLFDNMDVTDLAYAKSPIPIVWGISSSGNLLGLTYVPEQQVGAWHWHDTDGVFESLTVVAEGHEDVLYAVVRREIEGVHRRYVERLRSRQFVDPADAFFVDCGGTYDGAKTTTVSGLDWLEGKTVSILADGAVHPQRVVTGGAITLDNEASKVQVGLPIIADLQTLPVTLNLQDGSFGQGRFKNVNKAWLRVFRSSGIWVGPNEDNLTEAKQRTDEPYGSAPRLKTEEIEIMLSPSWGDSGQIFIRQRDPLPLTAVSLTLEIALGG